MTLSCHHPAMQESKRVGTTSIQLKTQETFEHS